MDLVLSKGRLELALKWAFIGDILNDFNRRNGQTAQVYQMENLKLNLDTSVTILNKASNNKNKWKER